MAKLIDADKLKNHYSWWKGGTREMTMDEAKSDFDTIIDLQPSVDIVRCGECRKCVPDRQAFNEPETVYCVPFTRHIGVNEFCSFGERRDP